MKNATKLVWLMVFFASSIMFTFGQSVNQMTLEEKVAYDNSIVVKATNVDKSVSAPDTKGSKIEIINESFASGIPGTWTQIQYSGTGSWYWSGSIGGSYGVPPNSDGLYATADSDYNSSALFNVGLFTPSMDLSGSSVCYIDFDRNYQNYAGWDEAAVNVYSGGTGPANLEQQLWYQESDDPSSGVHATYLIDPTTYADPSNVYIEFFYNTRGYTYCWNFAFDNLVVDLLPLGDVEGYVFNGGGLTIAGAQITSVDYGNFTASGPDGYYSLVGLPEGPQDLACTKDGYNPNVQPINILAFGMIQQDFIMTAPTMIISPTNHEYTLNPNEYYTAFTGVLNTGDGELEWDAAVTYLTDNVTDLTNLPVNWSGTVTPTDDVAATKSNGGESVLANTDAILRYDDGTNANSLGLTAGGEMRSSTYWPASTMSAYAGEAITQVEIYAYEGPAATYVLEIYGPGTSSSPGSLLFTETMNITATGWQTHVLSSPVAITGDDVWIGYNAIHTAGQFPSGFDGGPEVAGYGGWLNCDGSWITMTSIGFSANWNIATTVEAGAGSWLTLDYYNNTVPAGGGLDNVPTNFNAAGMSAGEVHTAIITFTSTPDVGTITIPCTLIVAGDPLNPPTDLTVTLVDDLTGEVYLEWVWTTDAFQYFTVKRDGTIIGTTSDTFYTDFLPDYGTYCYTVQAYYDEGSTLPTPEECVEWPLPEIFVDPDFHAAEVWVDHQYVWTTTIYNNGIGTLAYEFPEYLTDNLDYTTSQNQTGAPYSNEGLVFDKKLTEQYSGTGYAVVDGFGGPDAYGYSWIDSNEPGGPAYNWVDISATGTVVTGLSDDNVVGPFPIGFTFPFYGEDKTEFWVNSNGTIGFTSTYITLSNYSIPTGNSYVDFIAWFWDDLDPGNANTTVWYEDLGGVLCIQFDTYYEYPDGGEYLNAQVHMYANGRISILYDYIEPGFDVDGGTVGIQSSDNTLGLQVAYNANYIEAGLQVDFKLPTFVVDVDPATGVVPEGGNTDVDLTWDATGFDPGTYYADVEVTSNDPVNPSVMIGNEMTVVIPAEFAGTVTNCEGGDPLAGVTVTAGAFQTLTDVDGTYSLFVDEGTYDVYFELLGWETVMVGDTLALADEVTPIDVCLYESPYPVPWVLATVNYPDEDFCEVEWSLPEGPYEVSYDDGFAEDFFAWNDAGGENAVKFTPAGYPANIFGGRVFVGDGLFPAAPWLGTEFAILIYGDDGTGLPGDVLDSIGVTVNNYGWVEFSGLDVTLEEGDFFMSMLQLNFAPNTAPIGIDNSFPLAYRSYQRSALMPGWQVSVYQDFMMRAYIEGSQTDLATEGTELVRIPKVDREKANKHFISANNTPFTTRAGVEATGTLATIEGYEALTEDVLYYTVARISDFDPDLPIDPPVNGTVTVLNNVTEVSYTDNDFSALPMGWYAYAVQVAYSSGMLSEWTFSNIVGRDMDAAVTFEVTLCDGNTPEDVEITMVGSDYPYETFFGVTDETGIFTFDQVWKGKYDVTVFKIGYETYDWIQIVTEDVTIPVVLSEKRYPVRNLWVDPLTSYLYWDPPLVVALDEDFEGADFPPEGWQASSNSIGWLRTNSGSSTYWTIPAWDSYYAMSNDDAAGSGEDGSVDYLITPPLDLREVDTYHMMFDSYYDALFGFQVATVEYSYDAGANWTVLYGLTPNPGSWAEIDVDLGSLSGMAGTAPVWFAFHSDDGGDWSSGWAIDNVLVANGEVEPIQYHVFLDGALDGLTDTTWYQFAYLEYGTTYTACVAAEYSCGLSPEVCVDFTSTFLLPPRNLDGLTFDNTVHVWWEPPVTPETDATDGTSVFDPNFVSVTEESSAPGTTTAGSGQTKPLISTRAVLYDNGPLVTHEGTGAGGYDESVLHSGMSTLGFGAQLSAGNSMADDFEVTGSWDIDEIVLYAYQTNAGAGASTITGGYIQIYDGDPSAGGSVIWGDLSTNIMTSTEDAMIYRNSDGPGGGTTRAIMSVTCAVDVTLSAGTYWLEYQFDGSASFSGPWNPPITITGQPVTGNALQYTGSWGPALDGSGDQQGCVFQILGGGGGPGPGGEVPDNLIGYNLYRDMSNIAYIPYNGEDTTHYFDYDLDPLCYAYDVSAVYDLTPYGFPGETAESAWEGTFDICVEYGWPLTFVEDWNTGSFDPNLWTSGENWVVNGQFGNPYPCAEFKWDPVLVDYKSSLESYFIDGKYDGITGDEYIDGRIWFDFDLALEDNGMSGDETLVVEVWDGGSWYHVATFDNAEGSFDWTANHFEISDHAFGKIFKVRFTADGVSSDGILSWFVDNIVIYRQCDEPLDLTADGIDPFTIELNWHPPAGGGGGGGTTGEWIHWDDGVHANNAIGFGGAAVWSVAARFEPTDLAGFDGFSVTHIRFVPGANSNSSTFELKVWEGANASTLLYSQPVPTYLVAEWNEIELDTPVPIDITKELWIGYTTEQFTADDFPAGVDAGPAVANYGDLLTADGVTWEAMSIVYGLDYNWNLQGYVSGPTDGGATSIVPLVDDTEYTAQGAPQVNIGGGVGPAVSDDDNVNRELTGYNVYYNDNGAGYVFAAFTEDTTFTHVVDPAFEVGSNQCYYVTAVYEDCEPASNEACVMVTGIEDPALVDGIAVYPNPARDILNITSSTDITHVTVMNYVGQVVYNQKVVEDNSLELSVAGYETGVYIVKVETTAGIVTKKITVAH